MARSALSGQSTGHSLRTKPGREKWRRHVAFYCALVYVALLCGISQTRAHTKRDMSNATYTRAQ